MNDIRVAIALALTLTAGLAGRGTEVTARVDSPTALERVPLQIDGWHGADAGPLDAETAAAVGADRILNRVYRAPGSSPLGLYIAAYDRQRPSVSIHSPLHCLPGTGWSVLSDDTRPLANAASRGAIRRLVAVRDRDRVVILYWYAIHGRIVASDASSRLYLLADSLRFRRNDAALVRLVVPVSREDDAAAEAAGLSFVTALMPTLEEAL